MLSQRFCGGFDFLKLIDEYIVSDEKRLRERFTLRQRQREAGVDTAVATMRSPFTEARFQQDLGK